MYYRHTKQLTITNLQTHLNGMLLKNQNFVFAFRSSYRSHQSQIPDNMHNYISCPHYLQNFMKFSAVDFKEWCLQKCNRQTDRQKITICLCSGDIIINKK